MSPLLRRLSWLDNKAFEDGQGVKNAGVKAVAEHDEDDYAVDLHSSGGWVAALNKHDHARQR